MVDMAAAGAVAPAARPKLVLSPVAVAILATLAFLAARLLFQGHVLLTSLGDTDDATRLVQLRDWLAHGRWFDLTLPQIGAPEPLLSHWSRLIDLGLASILLPLTPVFGPDRAELAMRVIWPVLTLVTLTAVVARDAALRAGSVAGFAVAGFMLMSATAVYQFQPGRIDHHNVQILCAVAGILLLARAIDRPRDGWGAGAVLGLGLGVGLEGMSLVVPALALAVLLGLGRPDGLEGVKRTSIAFAAALALSVAATTAPGRLAVAVCDAAAVNLVALATFAASGVVLADAIARRVTGSRGLALQLGVLSLAGASGLAVYALLNPACLAGPFGEVPAALWPVWLSQVTEGQPIGYLLHTSPRETFAFLVIVMAALLARAGEIVTTPVSSEQPNARRQAVFLLSVQIAAILTAAAMVKMMPYAIWLAFPALAILVARLPAIGTLSPLVTRVAAFALLGQSTLAALLGVALAGLPKSAAPADAPARTACSDTATISALRDLPPGLILADLNIGPYIAALTDHRVATAPYHRLGSSIVTGQRALNGPPMSAEPAIRTLGATYVVACAAPLSSGPSAAPLAFEDALSAGVPPAYLEPIILEATTKLRVYRLKSPG